MCASVLRSNKIEVNCHTCGKKLFKIPSELELHKNIYCSRDCYSKARKKLTRELSSNWNGGIWITPDGYRFIKQEDGTYRGEHRLIMEKSLGRSLLSEEIVHHIDGDKLNNNIDNLCLMSRKQHADIHRDKLNKSRKNYKGGA